MAEFTQQMVYELAVEVHAQIVRLEGLAIASLDQCKLLHREVLQTKQCMREIGSLLKTASQNALQIDQRLCAIENRLS